MAIYMGSRVEAPVAERPGSCEGPLFDVLRQFAQLLDIKAIYVNYTETRPEEAP